MKAAPMLLMRLLPTTVTLGFLWLAIKQGRVLEIATALLVFLIECLQLVNVKMHSFVFKSKNCLLSPSSHNVPYSVLPKQWQY